MGGAVRQPAATGAGRVSGLWAAAWDFTRARRTGAAGTVATSGT